MVTDRVVQEVGSKPLIGDGQNPFSAYLNYPNIVLLGDPGSGKTHLLTEFAQLQGGAFHLARSFLNKSAEILGAQNTFFIDALDERRSVRGDSNATDELVKKLFQVNPKQVRLSCRAADWLGETDLVAFKDYFDVTGGYVVLSLQPLSRTEQNAVLTASGIEDTESFLAGADAAGQWLNALLGNPQNLKMLADVVRKHGWPSTRSELFQQAVDILVSEKNKAVSQKASNRYSANELLDTAGELCAVRLISDIQAISLCESDAAEDIPSYRTVSHENCSKLMAALGRRVFAMSAMPETVDYAHRVIAEYLAASWLSTKIRAGLPIGRVRALIGVEGRPATELRGLHAWMAVQLPEHAELLINADPFGVLTYADARALTPTNRKQLLTALARLADIDPWFRDGHWASSSLAGLAGAGMIEEFRSILSSETPNFSLRMLILDSLSVGQPVRELSAELLLLVLNTEASYAERSSSVDALLHMGDCCALLLAKSYDKLGVAAEDIRIKSKLFKCLGGKQLDSIVLPQLFREVFSSKAKVSFDSFYRISDGVPDNEVGGTLDQLVVCLKDVTGNSIREDAYSVEGEFGRLLFRGLSIEKTLEGGRLLSWLKCRRQVANLLGGSTAQEVHEQLAAHSETAIRGMRAAIRALSIDESIWSNIHHLQGIGLIGWGDPSFLQCVVDAMEAEVSIDRKVYLYHLALNVTIFQIGPVARSTFEYLVEFGEGAPLLEEVRQSCCLLEIPDWRLKDAERSRERERKVADGRARNRSEFASQAISIRNGMHLSWLGWIAQVYFAIFNDVNREATPFERLATELGASNAEVAIEGMLALVRREEITPMSEILRMHSENKHYVWWYTVIAGLDLHVEQGGQISDLSDEYLKAALAIDAFCTTSVYSGNISSQYVHPWKTLTVEKRPELALDAYRQLARYDLARSAQSAYGLYDLLHQDQFQPFRAETATALLTEFPSAPDDSLRRLIRVAMSECDVALFVPLVRDVIARGLDRDDALSLWLAAGYVASPDDFVSYCNALDDTGLITLIWALRDLSGYSRRANNHVRVLSSEQLEQILRWVISRFPRTSHPEGGWSGDTNTWDAADFVLRLVALLSSHPSTDAALSLQRLATDPSAKTYLNDIKHAMAQQRIRMIDAQYRQPTVQQVVKTLSNSSPASAADLHALLIDHLESLKPHIASANVDVYKRFWSEDRYGKVTNPKNEESCRDYLIELLRNKTVEQKVVLEPEGHMAADKRADIVALLPGIKLVLELKRDYHAKVWDATQEQLERFYTRDPEAKGYGIYVVLWFGLRRTSAVPLPPHSYTRPDSASEMQNLLQALIPAEKRHKIGVVVLDVSGEIPAVI